MIQYDMLQNVYSVLKSRWTIQLNLLH